MSEAIHAMAFAPELLPALRGITTSETHSIACKACILGLADEYNLLPAGTTSGGTV